MDKGDAQIQTCTLQGLPSVLQRHGVAPGPLLARHGLSPRQLLLRNEYMPYWTYATLLREAAELCGTPHLGLLLSQPGEHSLQSQGVFGVLLRYCETLGEALEAICRYYHAISGGARYALARHADEAHFTREGLAPGLRHDRILQDLSLSDFVVLLRTALGPDWRPLRVCFTHAPPAELGPYHELLGVPAEFSASRQAIVFPAADLARTMRPSAAARESLVHALARQVRDQHDGALAPAVNQAIDALLPTGVCCARSVAAVFDIHPRTLHRRLAREGARFSALLDERRRQHACSYLVKSSMSIAGIGMATGYAAPEAFTRAFRRWHGMTPQRWRETHGAAPAKSDRQGPP